MPRSPFVTSNHLVAACVLLCTALGPSACRRATDATPPLATPSFSPSRDRVALGSPVDVVYRFVVARDGPKVPDDLLVMVHFLDGDEELLWTDDHEPPVPTGQWKPGQTIEYSRTVFVPIFPYVGPVVVHMGLYSPATGQRYPLSGESPGQREYPVGSLELVPRPEDAFIIYKDGWHNAEVSRENAVVEWQWTKKSATLAFRNPKRDALFYLDLDGRPDLVGGRQEITLRVGDTVVDTFELTDRKQVLHKVPIQAAQFGDGESVDLTIAVNQTFVPASIPAAQSNDPRELGVRVFHAYIEPK